MVSRTIRAPIERVFEVVAHVEEFRKANPRIVKIEFLSSQHTGVGTRFRETRKVGGREASCVLEVTEYVPPERVRIVSEMGGSIWDTVFTLKPVDEGVELTMVMEAHAKNFFARMMNALIKGMIRKAVAEDKDAVKAYCEK
jgi:uncharacterized protein YndB with AHSA1/START domain